MGFFIPPPASGAAKRVLFAGLFHETHTFVRGVTGAALFKMRRGTALLAAINDASTLAGGLQSAREQEWVVIPALHGQATPSALVADAVVESFWHELREKVASVDSIDGVFLDLHGAMVSESLPDVEGELLRRLRELPGYETIPVCGSLDLHGNITDAMCGADTVGVAYRCNPHTDARDAAVGAARILGRLMESGERVVTVRRQPPLVFAPPGTGTADEPMRSLLALARRIESEEPEILCVNVFAGFAYADIAQAGVSFTAATVGDPARARARLGELCRLAWETRAAGCPAGMAVDDAIRQALASPGDKPAILIEPADNIGGGAPGDLTVVLKALLAAGVPNAAVCLCSPNAVLALQGAAPGTVRTVSVGGESGEIGAEPLSVELTVVSHSDGAFRLEDTRSHAAVMGLAQEMGPSVVAQVGGVTLLLTSKRVMPFDLAQWRSQGITPEQRNVIAVKAAVAHRQAYDPIARASYTLDTEGPCAQNLTRLPYKNIRRPIYPLDDV